MEGGEVRVKRTAFMGFDALRGVYCMGFRAFRGV
jgi:hypothetical protein